MLHLKMSLYSHHLTHCEDVAVDVEAHVEACEGDAISAVGIVLVAGTRIFCKNADQAGRLASGIIARSSGGKMTSSFSV